MYIPIEKTVYYTMPVNWMLVSFMTLSPEQQLKHFQGPLLSTSDEGYGKPTKNHLIGLLWSLMDYTFVDNELPNYEEVLIKNKALQDLLCECSGSNADSYLSYECFMYGEYWRQIREKARELLEATGLGFYPNIPEQIDFNYREELVDCPED